MVGVVGKAILVLGVALGASILVTFEMLVYADSMLERECRAETGGSCAYTFIGAMAVGTVAGLAALVATLVGMVFFVAGRRAEAKMILGGLVVLLAIAHAWPLF